MKDRKPISDLTEKGRMKFASRSRATGIVALSMFAFAVPLLAQEDVSGRPWALSLAAQLRSEKRCDLQTTYFVRELPTPEGGTVFSGRVKCIDGREFDFSQSKPHLKFDLNACEPTTC